MSDLRKQRVVVLLGVLFVFALLVTQKINLVTADLGRHLKNGEIVLCLQDNVLEAQIGILQKNWYSYTYSDYPFLNHHWGSGVIFFLIHKLFGFVGISLFFTTLSLVTFLLFFLIACKMSRFSMAVIVSLITIPVIISRVEIRPEIFSYFFCGVFWWMLKKIKEDWGQGRLRGRKRWLLTFPLVEVFWVNLHIYFFMGLFLIGIFLLEEGIFSLKEKKYLSNLGQLGYLGKILGLSTLASLVNPAGLKGFFYPLRIFKDYGYRLLENQSVWFLDRIIKYPPNIYFKICFGLLVLSLVFSLIKRQNIYLSDLVFSLFFSCLAWSSVRNFALFGYVVLPIIAGNLRLLGEIRRVKEELWFFAFSSLMSLIVLVLFFLNPSYWRQKLSFGLGLRKDTARAAEFFKKENISGPIFNNYDIGGYLIYYLFPKERVFVDNRPEAYPREFFTEVYVPMQEQEEVWKKTDQKYNFNAIFFYRHDLTPWSQTFLVSCISDPSWAPVYVDDYAIIFLKRSKTNKDLIKKFELPKEMFKVQKS